MEKVISGYSVDENLFTRSDFYGELGNLVGVIDYNGNNVAIIKNQQGEYIYRDTVIDVSAIITKDGPSISERIFMGSTENQLDDKTVKIIKEGNLNTLGKGEINIDLGLQQCDNSVFVAEDELLNHLKICKKMHPDLPLNYAIKEIPYEKSSTQTM